MPSHSKIPTPHSKIVFMGSPDFAVPSLQALVEAGYPPVAVVTAPDKRRGRGAGLVPTPVKQAAGALGIETVMQPESLRDPAFADAVASLEPDLLVVVAFRILPPEVYELPRLGAFNLHGSLLPRYRGAAPIHHAVMNGDSETGVTTFFLQRKVDTGDVILRRTMPIGPDETTGEVYERMMRLGAEAVVETVRRIERGDVEPQPQDDAQATPAPKVFAEQGEIDWSRPAADVHNHIRGFSPIPTAWTTHEGVKLKLFRSRVADGAETAGAAPGTILEAGARLVVACGHGAVELVELQQPGRKRLDAVAFLNGYPLEVGARLGA